MPRTYADGWSLLRTPWFAHGGPDGVRTNPPRVLPTIPPRLEDVPVSAPRPFRPPSDGIVLYDGPSLITGRPILAIATGYLSPSQNAKTGPMVQTWILVRDMPPQAALDTGADDAICGDCPSRGALAELPKPLPRAYRKRGTGWQRGEAISAVSVAPRGRSCYVAVGKAPNGIWWAWRNGAYPVVDSPREQALFAYGRAVRIGSYGDPAAVPAQVWEALISSATMWTGYTHQWRLPQSQPLKAFLMASVDSEAEAQQARSWGWRTFRVREKGGPIVAGHEITCPASDEALEAKAQDLAARASAGDKKAAQQLEQGRLIQCVDCKACQGVAARTKRSVVIEKHGYLDKESGKAAKARAAARRK